MKKIILVLCFLTGLLTGCNSQKEMPMPMVELTKDESRQQVDVRIDGQLFTSYRYSAELEKPVLWPVLAANGREVTRGYPINPRGGERVDHPHHLGVWLNYGDVNGLDFWNNSSAVPPERAHRYGVIRQQEISGMEDGQGSGSLSVTAKWQDHTGQTLLTEETRLHFQTRDSIRFIDRTTTLTATTDTVNLDDNKEGMFAIRVARELELPSGGKQKLWGADGQVQEVENPDNAKVSGDYLSSEGITGGEVWGTRASWMKLAGTIDGGGVAIVIYDHPDNVGYPTYWHARTYGLFAANPLGQKVFSKGEKELNFRLKPGESVTFKYRLAVFSSDPSVEEIERLGY